MVETAWRTCDACVPFRFGQWFETEAAAGAATAERESELEAALARVRSASEFGIRVLDPEAASGEEPVRAPEGGSDAPEGAGRAYMEALRQRAGEARTRRERGDVIGDELREVLGDMVLDERATDRPSTPHTLVEVAHLVPRGREDAYRAAVDRARAARPELRFLVSGPWPPYSFAP